jgi:uncharacterized protein YneR
MTIQQLIDKLNTIEDKDNTIAVTRGYEKGYDDIDNIIPEPITMVLNVNDEWYFGKHEKLSEVYDREDIEEYTITKAIIL